MLRGPEMPNFAITKSMVDKIKINHEKHRNILQKNSTYPEKLHFCYKL